jgi:hypothetical protein
MARRMTSLVATLIILFAASHSADAQRDPDIELAAGLKKAGFTGTVQ